MFLDFQKAFETVNHGILLDKWHHHIILDPVYGLFSSYSNDRYQCVVHGGCKFEQKYIRIYNVESPNTWAIAPSNLYQWFSISFQLVHNYFGCRYDTKLFGTSEKFRFPVQWIKYLNVWIVLLGNSQYTSLNIDKIDLCYLP